MKLVDDFLEDYKRNKTWDEKTIELRTNKLLKDVKKLCEW